MITAQSLSNEILTVVLDNGKQILTATKDHPRWEDLVKAYSTGDESKLLDLLNLKKIVEQFSDNGLTVSDNGVFYNNTPLAGTDVNRILAYIRQGIPYFPIARYMVRKLANSSRRAIDEMYNFLEHKNMPLTPEGKIIAYKGVRSSFYSVMGNTETVVLQGVTDSEGHILNKIGETIEIKRSSCDDDFRNGCSFGLHAGSLAYARDWARQHDGVIILVEIDPADVVSVPEDCNCSKLRCCKYKVIGLYDGPLPDAYVDFNEKLDVVEPTEVEDEDEDEDADWYEDEDEEDDDSLDNPEEEEEESSDPNQVDNLSEYVKKYEEGYKLGKKNGTRRRKRLYRQNDELNSTYTEEQLEFIRGYNAGYLDARWDYKK